MAGLLGFTLTDQELSALVEACNVANRNQPRPPWNTDGRSAWAPLIREDIRRGKCHAKTQ